MEQAAASPVVKAAVAAEPVLDVASSVLSKKWVMSPNDTRLVAGIAQAYQLPEIVARLLVSRGVAFDDVENFLDPTIKTYLPNPSVLKDMDKAAERIAAAIMTGEKVAVFGDYDVDGATSTAILKRYFGMAGSDIRVYIPDRIKEGYGPNTSALLQLKAEGMTLVLTVDCGVTAFEPLAAATAAGLDMIVFDHHEAEPKLPDAVAVVNPNRIDEDRSLGNLAACGVSFLACVAVNRVLRRKGWFNDQRPEPRLTTLLDLVALGTVCDVVPLTGVNRAFVAQGLRVMALRQNKGLVALQDVAAMSEAPGTYHAGFILGPRVNAGGRVGEAGMGSRLLSTDNEADATVWAQKLHDFNAERRDIEALVLEQALAGVENSGLSNDRVILATGDGWHPGVIGIVAARLKEKYNRPACVIAFDDKGIGKASGRSVSGVDLGSAVISGRQKGLLINGGGHKMAAGFTISRDMLEDFRAHMNAHVDDQLGGQALVSQLRIDGILSVNALTADLVRMIEKMAPFGAGNSEPRFTLSSVRIVRPEVLGESHVRCLIQDTAGGSSVKGIAFRCLETPLGEALLKAGTAPCHITGHVRINRWMGRESVDFQIVDLAKLWT